MLSACLAIFFVHLVLMGLDEFRFHSRRNLSSSEKWARPLETICLIGCFSFALWAPLTLPTLWFYLTLAISCIIFSLRDEFIRLKSSDSQEKRIHAFLFINQPLLFIANGFFWWVLSSDRPPSFLLKLKQNEELIFNFLLFLCLIGGAFALYQLATWSRKIEEKPEDSDMKESN